MKSGTTALSAYLADHPDVYMARGKEMHFFDMHHKRGEDWYKNKFFSAKAGQKAGEATPVYMYDADAFARMADLLPHARLIAILRNPTDRAYSHYWHNVARGEEKLSFENALESEASRIAKAKNHIEKRHVAYVDRGRYAEQITRLLTRYPLEALLILKFEDMASDPISTYARVCRHIGVREDHRPQNIGHKYHRGQSRVSRLKEFIASNLPYGLSFTFRDKFSSNAYLPMERKTRTMLVEKFRDSNNQLGAILGSDFSEWNH